MFFDVIKLKTNSWHWRLHRWLFSTFFWDENPTNFCPYFWITVFTLLLSPIMIPVKLIVTGIISFVKWSEKPLEATAEFLETYVFGPLDRQRISNLKYDDKFFSGVMILAEWGDREILDLLQVDYAYKAYWKRGEYILDEKLRTGTSERLSKLRGDIEKWKQANPNWKELLEAELKRRATYIEKIKQEVELANKIKARKEAESALKKIKMRNKVVKITSVVGPICLLIMTGISLYGLVIVLMRVDWAQVGNVLGGLIALVALCVVIYFILKGLFRLIASDTMVDNFFRPAADGFIRAVIWFFNKLWKGIVLVLSMFFDWKKENCPGIDWEE